MRSFVIAAIIISGVALAACHDTTSPAAQPRIAGISGITVPARAGESDTVPISFIYTTAPCDTSIVETRQSFSGVRFTVTAFATNQPCIAVLSVEHPFHYSVLPVHAVPLSVMFTEPDGKDSVRIVSQ